MKKLILNLIIIILNPFIYLNAQGLLEQNKFYYSPKINFPTHELFSDTNSYYELNEIVTAQPEIIIKNEYLISNLFSTIKNLEGQKIAAQKQELNFLKDKLAELNKQIEDLRKIASNSLKIKNNMKSEKIKSNIEKYQHAQEGYEKNISDIQNKRDSSNNSEIQRLRDSTAIYLSPFVSSFKLQLGLLNNFFYQFESYAKNINEKNFLINDSCCSILLDSIIWIDTSRIRSIKREIDNGFIELSKKQEELRKNLKQPKSPNEQLAAVPGVTTLLGNAEVIPEISFLAGKDFSFISLTDKIHVSGEVKLFTSSSASSTKDSSSLTDRQKVFIQSSSNYGIVSQFTLSCIKSKDQSFRHLGLNLNANFLGKNFKPDSTEQFNVSTLNFKAGAEWAFWKGLSVYGNINSLFFLTNIEELNKYIGAPKNKGHWFFDIGSKILLNLTDDKTLGIGLDINLVLINPDIKREIYPSKDPVIPNIKLGLRKSF